MKSQWVQVQVRITLLVLAGMLAEQAMADCPPAGYTREQLLDLKSKQFEVSDATRREALAIGLLPCLASPDPQLRDGIAFEALSTWMRGKAITTVTATRILASLQPQLADEYPDPEGVARPFAALVLSEVARMDRIEAFMTDAQREALLQAATSCVRGVRDYRGFDERSGWRHGVAHGADLLLQLALNPKIDKQGLDAILGAIATQVAPAGEHFYIYGESERLARPVFFIAQRKLHSQEDWQRWLQQVTVAAPLPSWDEAFRSQAGLARRHNTNAFLLALYLFVRESGNAEVQAHIYEPLRAAIAALP